MNDTINERLKIYIQYKRLNINSFANLLGYSSSEKIGRLIRNTDTKPSYDIILDISNKFDDLNLIWLITGKGEMLKPDEEIKLTQNGKINVHGTNHGKITISEANHEIEILKERLKGLENEIEAMKREIKIKDEFINFLKEAKTK